MAQLSEWIHDALHRIMFTVISVLLALFVWKRLAIEAEKDKSEDETIIIPTTEDTFEIIEAPPDEVDGPQNQVFITSEDDVHSTADSEMIEDEMQKQLSKCKCTAPLRMHRLGGGKYRVCH